MAGQADRKCLLRPSLVPPAPIRRLRDYTRLRTDLTHDLSRQWNGWKTARRRPDQVVGGGHRHHGRVRTAIIEALIASSAIPRCWPGGAGPHEDQHWALVAALDRSFYDHHAELARMLLTRSTP